MSPLLHRLRSCSTACKHRKTSTASLLQPRPWSPTPGLLLGRLAWQREREENCSHPDPLTHSLFNLAPELLNWKYFQSEEKFPGKNYPTARTGHSTQYHDNKLIIFGGQQKITPLYPQHRQVNSEVYVYNLVKLSWTFVECRGPEIPPRTNHAACLVGTQVLVQGGLTAKEKILSDTWSLSLGNSALLRTVRTLRPAESPEPLFVAPGTGKARAGSTFLPPRQPRNMKISADRVII